MRIINLSYMKKILLTLLISFGIYTSTFAQQFWSESNKKLEFGVDVGYNTSYLNGNVALTTAYSSGFNAGVFGEYYFSDSWGIKAKASYDQKGWANGTFTDASGNETDGVTYHLNYITIPIMANWHFGGDKNWYLNFGPYAGILMSANASIPTPDLKSSFNSTDFGLSYGVGVKFPIGDMKLFIEAGGQAGLDNIFKESDGTYLNARGSLNIGVNF